MTLSDFIKDLKKLEKAHGKKTVVYSCDDEGNGYSDVYYAPGVISTESIGSVYRGEAKGDVVCVN